MSITDTLQKFMDDTYTTPCWDVFTVLDEYVAVADPTVACDLEDWLLEHNIPLRDRRNETGIALFQIVNKTL